MKERKLQEIEHPLDPYHTQHPTQDPNLNPKPIIMRAYSSSCLATILLAATLVAAGALVTVVAADDPIGSNQDGFNINGANRLMMPSENYEENKQLIQNIFRKHPMLYQELLRSIQMPTMQNSFMPQGNPQQLGLTNLNQLGMGQYQQQQQQQPFQGPRNGYSQFQTPTLNYNGYPGNWIQGPGGFPMQQQQPQQNWGAITSQYQGIPQGLGPALSAVGYRA